GGIVGGVGRKLRRQAGRRGVPEDDELTSVVAKERFLAAPEERDLRHHLGRVREGPVLLLRQTRVYVNRVVVLVPERQAAHPLHDIFWKERPLQERGHLVFARPLVLCGRRHLLKRTHACEAAVDRR